jgi:hypothetical protein
MMNTKTDHSEPSSELDGYVGFCTRCSLKIESFEGLTQCPRCGSKGVPCGYDAQVSISVNTHELRILCIWAENWAGSTDADEDTVYAIAARLRRQLGDNDYPLTMADEFRALKAAGVDYETNHPAGDQP